MDRLERQDCSTKMTELSDQVKAITANPGPARFLAVVLEHLKRSGNGSKTLKFDPPLTADEEIQLTELLGTDPKTMSRERVNLTRARKSLARIDGLTLEDLVAGVFGEVVTRSDAKDRREARKRLEIAGARFLLVQVMQREPQLQAELALLLNEPIRSAYKVPPDSKSLAQVWMPYEAAVLCAVEWWDWRKAEPEYPKIPERYLLSNALRNSKSERLSRAGKRAFLNLIDRENYEDAVERAETGIRLSGPLVWKTEQEQVVADGKAACPWIEVPSTSIRTRGYIDAEHQGILLIENLETFEQICRKTNINERWLCIWNEGFASHDLIEFVKPYRYLPVAATCDLDPSGIQIVQDLKRRLGFEVTPVCMEVETWQRGLKLKEKPKAHAKWQAQAIAMRDTCPESLRPLAAAIAETGERVEQEEKTYYRALTRGLPQELDALHQLHVRS